MKKLSIKIKITAWYTLAMIIVSVIALSVMASTTKNVLEREEVGMLINIVNGSARRVHVKNGAIEYSTDFRHTDGGVYIVVYDGNGNKISGDLPENFDDTSGFADDKVKTAKGRDNKVYHIYDRSIYIPDYGTVKIRGMKDTVGSDRILKSIIRNNILIYMLIIFATAAGGFILIKKALKPVEKISATAKKISESSNLSQRIALGDGKDEMYVLANTFDDMLNKIEYTFEKEKQFTSDASHELRTPVSVIMSECDYAQSCELTKEEYGETIEVISRQAERMTSLISQLLTISRMDRNAQKVNFEEFDLKELLEIVCDEQIEIHDEKIKLTLRSENKATIIADKSLVARLLINLINNAYKYGRDGGNITVSLTCGDDFAVISVKDDGIGITEENLNKIWDRFYRVDTSRTDNESMGLGLAMVKQIVQAHGGTAEVNSVPEEGTEFVIKLPTDARKSNDKICGEHRY